MARRRPNEPTVNPARGAALVVVAVLLGLVLLRNGLDTSEVVTSSRDTSSTDAGADGGDAATDEGTDEGADEGDTGGEETPTTDAARPPAEVTVIVLNGTSVAGTAGNYSTAIGSAGYQMLEPGNATTKTAVTLVHYVEGFEAEAAAVAIAAGAPATVSPTPLPDPAPGDVGAANVVVVIGTDIASVTPTTAADAAAPDDTTATDG